MRLIDCSKTGALRRRLGDAARRDHADQYEINNYVTRLVSIWRNGGTELKAGDTR